MVTLSLVSQKNVIIAAALVSISFTLHVATVLLLFQSPYL